MNPVMPASVPNIRTIRFLYYSITFTTIYYSRLYYLYNK